MTIAAQYKYINYFVDQLLALALLTNYTTNYSIIIIIIIIIITIIIITIMIITITIIIVTIITIIIII